MVNDLPGSPSQHESIRYRQLYRFLISHQIAYNVSRSNLIIYIFFKTKMSAFLSTRSLKDVDFNWQEDAREDFVGVFERFWACLDARTKSLFFVSFFPIGMTESGEMSTELLQFKKITQRRQPCRFVQLKKKKNGNPSRLNVTKSRTNPMDVRESHTNIKRLNVFLFYIFFFGLFPPLSLTAVRVTPSPTCM